MIQLSIFFFFFFFPSFYLCVCVCVRSYGYRREGKNSERPSVCPSCIFHFPFHKDVSITDRQGGGRRRRRGSRAKRNGMQYIRSRLLSFFLSDVWFFIFFFRRPVGSGRSVYAFASSLQFFPFFYSF